VPFGATFCKEWTMQRLKTLSKNKRLKEQEEKASATLNGLWSLAGGLGAGGG